MQGGGAESKLERQCCVYYLIFVHRKHAGMWHDDLPTELLKTYLGSWVPRQGVVCAWRLNQTVWDRRIEQSPQTTESAGTGAAGEWLPLARWPVAEQRASGACYLFLSLEMNTELPDSLFHIVRWSVSRPCNLLLGDRTGCFCLGERKKSG